MSNFDYQLQICHLKDLIFFAFLSVWQSSTNGSEQGYQSFPHSSPISPSPSTKYQTYCNHRHHFSIYQIQNVLMQALKSIYFLNHQLSYLSHHIYLDICLTVQTHIFILMGRSTDHQQSKTHIIIFTVHSINLRTHNSLGVDTHIHSWSGLAAIQFNISLFVYFSVVHLLSVITKHGFLNWNWIFHILL